MTSRKNLRNVKTQQLRSIALDSKRAIENVRAGYLVAGHILDEVEHDIGSIGENDFDVYFSRYGKSIEFSRIKRKIVYNAFLMTLINLYDHGVRSKSYDDNIKYTFESSDCTIGLKVSTELVGCKLVSETVIIPESVIPEHTETKTVIKCDN